VIGREKAAMASASDCARIGATCSLGFADLYPVILVVYDAGLDRAYWLAIQGHFSGMDRFARLRGKTVTIPIPIENVLDASAMREFARRKMALFPSEGEQS
jgi:hypothetical protein